MKLKITPTGREAVWDDQSMIVSKTDLSGRITYVNRTFMRVSNFAETDVLGVQHNVVRHPDMPRGVFRFLWETLKEGREFFGYVKNMSADGDHYWVFANVTPDLDCNGKAVGYYSVRRKAERQAIQVIEPVYREMLVLEARVGPANAPAASIQLLQNKLRAMGTSYDKFVLGLFGGRS